MSLQKLFKERLDAHSPEAISKLLGYSSVKKIMPRIESMINSRYLDLDKGGFDLRYSTPKLISKLASVLDIPTLVCDKVIDEINAELQAKSRRFKPYIFIETNFKRTSQPVFALAVLQGNRFLAVEEVAGALSLNDQLKQVQEQIKAHYLREPIIDMWGEVKQYVYYYEEDLALVFSTNGQLLQATNEYFYSKATLSL